MSKINVVYWSQTGNTEEMAEESEKESHRQEEKQLYLKLAQFLRMR